MKIHELNKRRIKHRHDEKNQKTGMNIMPRRTNEYENMLEIFRKHFVYVIYVIPFSILFTLQSSISFQSLICLCSFSIQAFLYRNNFNSKCSIVGIFMVSDKVRFYLCVWLCSSFAGIPASLLCIRHRTQTVRQKLRNTNLNKYQI